MNCKAWGKTAQVAGDYVRKGSKVAIVGRLEIEQWTDRSSGEVRSKTLVVIDRLELCGSRSGGEALAGAALDAADNRDDPGNPLAIGKIMVDQVWAEGTDPTGDCRPSRRAAKT